jgi:HK97 family phage prohead protease
MTLEHINRDAIPSTMTRFASFAPASYNSKTRTVDAIFATGAPVKRYGWYIEELAMESDAINLQRAAEGRMSLLFNHDVDLPIGVVEEARLEVGVLKGRLRFNDNEIGHSYEGMVSRGELSGISIGYRIDARSLVSEGGSTETWRMTRWELLEVSLVTVPADAGAKIRSNPIFNPESGQETRSTFKESAMPEARNETVSAVNPSDEITQATPVETRAQAQNTPPTLDAKAVLLAERKRISAINDVASRVNNMRPDVMGAADIDNAINEGLSVDAFRHIAFDRMASQDEARETRSVRVERDANETRAIAMTEAMAHRMGATGELSEPAREYAGRSIVELAAIHVGHRGFLSSPRDKEAVLDDAFGRRSGGSHTLSDFPILFENAMNRALQARYNIAQSSYRRIARQRTYVDFRDHHSVRFGDFPTLQPIQEGGEIKGGTLVEARERTRVTPYGVSFAITRQMLVNDSLGGIDRALNTYGDRVMQFEDKTFYSMLTSGVASNGPTLIEGNAQVFAAGRNNLAGAGTVIDVAALDAGRKALRKQTNLDGEPLDITPKIILVSPDRETQAQQLLAPLQAAQASNVNPFTATLQIIATARLTGNAWYLFESPDILPCFEWGLLEGYTAPRMRLESPFGTQGLSVSLEHDFGCGAIDFRGAYRNPGA